jgi:hypothetical protein
MGGKARVHARQVAEGGRKREGASGLKGKFIGETTTQTIRKNKHETETETATAAMAPRH